VATRQLKKFEDLLIHFDRKRERDGQTDGQSQTNTAYDTIRYDNVYLKCSKKLKGSLPHGINTK